MKRAQLFPQTVVACFSVVALTGGCGGRVDLGGGPLGSMSGGNVADAEAAIYLDGGVRHVRTESVVDSSWYCSGVAVDDTYFYLLHGADFDESNSMYRCVKKDCAATLSRVAGSLCPSCQVESFERVGQRLAIGDWDRGVLQFDTCTLPDCADERTVIGNVPGGVEALGLDGQRLYLKEGMDPVIYACALPDCSGGPQVLASGTSVGSFTADRGDVYWSDGANRVSRTRGDGSAAVETFVLGGPFEQLDGGGGGGTGALDAGEARVIATGRIRLDGDWLYATVIGECSLYGPCAGSLVRWPRDFSGPRQTLSGGSNIVNNVLVVFDGEVVFSKEGSVWSCRADDCAATERVLDDVDPVAMAADKDYLYWCIQSAPPAGLRRVPRIAH